MSTKKAGGTAKNLTDSKPKYLGVKKADGQLVKTGQIIVRQRGTKIEAGKNVKVASDHTLFAMAEGKVVFKNSGVVIAPKNNPQQLKASVQKQPISVGIQANEPAFKLYKSGVLSSACDSRFINHAVLVVGYATSSTQQDYWIVKNSWGTDWGINGYVYIARGNQNAGDGVCGINKEPAYPIF